MYYKNIIISSCLMISAKCELIQCFYYICDLEQVSLQQLMRRMQQDVATVDMPDSVSPTRQVPIYVHLIRSTASTL